MSVRVALLLCVIRFILHYFVLPSSLVNSEWFCFDVNRIQQFDAKNATFGRLEYFGAAPSFGSSRVLDLKSVSINI